ncbi:MAG: T9SS type A sorting domain-containing protein, partial [Bacteroidetes bacterium]|nr:T9SS type A sorting domain-containing protein [Bacteroidota bacterium]
VNSTDSILIYYYTQGTNNLKLVVTDNDGAKDSSQTTVTLKSFDKKFKGGILGGITALNPNTIFTADSTFDATNGASIYKLDKSGNTVFSLVVSSKIYTTPSVSSDSSVFITSGTSLNGFNKAGAPLWSTIPLGGLSQVTPTVDSVLSRIYVGVSNKNFFGIDYKTGKVIWNVFCDAPINASAVISGDRKLVFVSEAGTLYGFDIRSDSALTVPKWKLTLGEIISKSAAIDADNNFYFGTKFGNLLKIKLNSNGVAEKVWSSSLTDPIESSPVIDSKGNLYIGTTKGKFHKISSSDGKIIWTYESSGSIKSTPAITEYGTIIFATTNGNVVSLDTLKNVRWTHKESSPISSNLLYIENMTYVGTEAGNLVAIYDNPNTNTVNTSLSKISIPNGSQSSLADIKTSYKQYFNLDLARQRSLSSFITTAKTEKPVWGTFQGDYRRTGSMSYECPAPAVVNVPDCKFGSDSIIISTSSMQNRYWVINDQVLKNIKDPIIKVSATDTYKIQSFNDIGCIVNAIDKKLINLGVIKEKPTISTNTGSYKFCIGDSLVMTSSISAKNYKWYFSGFEISSSNSKSLTTNISGAYSLAVYDSLGCKAVSDVSLVMATNPPAKPAITRAQLDLVSSNSAGNQWYLNNEKISGATSQTFKPLQSGNYKVKTILNGCESALSENYYYLTTAVNNLSNGEYFKISPNPTSGELNINYRFSSNKDVYISVIDINGRNVILNRKINSGSKINLGSVSKGSYFIQVKDAKGRILNMNRFEKL